MRWGLFIIKLSRDDTLVCETFEFVLIEHGIVVLKDAQLALKNVSIVCIEMSYSQVVGTIDSFKVGSLN